LLHVVDLAVAHARLERVALDERRVGGVRAGVEGAAHGALDGLGGGQRCAHGGGAHVSVPPTVRPSMRSVGRPTPTGTDWPSSPHVPIPESRRRSLPIRETRVSTSGPLPISMAPRTGAPIRPFSIR